MASHVPALVLGVLCGFGGVMGYVRTKSIPSIVAGVSVGALYLLSSNRIANFQPYGIELALLASVVLGGSSIPRAIKTSKPLPIGLAGLALFGGAYYGSKWIAKFRSQSGPGAVKINKKGE
ncbi:hypothetical protein BJ508DRAFT_301686 [Ascobolus immersus RN42]|uniref:TMEM14-domain-containing protein n=1 Tax=Ascobolus immersus RN42 TaxID=1160509 RepID=A0A3N4IL73_ASCIM|nr:hypothetical protein BJ508DRAFT_301686 [Ascobolus immersus RN42]